MYNYSLNEYLENFLSLSNPILYAIVFVVIIIIIAFLIKREVITPLNKHFDNKTRAMEEEHNRKMALFADLDPDPLFRIDENGSIIQSNESARKLLKEHSPDQSVKSLLPNGLGSVSELIDNNETTKSTVKIGGSYYAVEIKGISRYKIAHIYFHDMTQRIISEKKLMEFQKYMNKKSESDRKFISKELHDNIGQHLLFLKLRLQEMSENTGNGLGGQFRSLYSTIDEANLDLKEICNTLTPRILEHRGLFSAIESLVRHTSKNMGIEGKVTFHGEKISLDYETELEIYRIVQEALTNIIKHAGADHFQIDLISTPISYVVVISDNGKGFDVDRVLNSTAGGFGLMNIRERANNIGGGVVVDSDKDLGTNITITINWNEDEKSVNSRRS